MTIAWVLGSGGLLGSALSCAIQRTTVQLFIGTERFSWNNETELVVQLRGAVKSFAAAVRDESHWQIYWAAGIGTMHSSEEELAIETRTLSALLDLIRTDAGLASAKGCFIFASSAGAIYAGTKDNLINENTTVSPTTAYAREKLKQERLVSNLAISSCRMIVVLARISTLYGAGQATGKQQGLVAEIARRMLRNQPIRIYVPFDTIRDYINSHDAATAIVETANALSEKIGVFTKIIAAEIPVTIAEIISIFKRISRRSPRIVVSTSKMGAIYVRRIQFHSLAFQPDVKFPRTSLLVGISQVMAAERLAFAQNNIKSNSRL